MTLAEARSLAPELAQLPDDVVAMLLRQHGPSWWDSLGAFKGLAAAKGLPLLEVLTAAAHDRLADILRRPGA